jgi:hypothetical protein
MSWIWPILVVVVVLMWTFALVDIIRRRHDRSGGKIAAWVIIILVFPVLGAIVYFLANVGGGASDVPRDADIGGRPL